MSNDEHILQELRRMNAQLNPGKAVLKAFGLLVLAAIVFTAVATLVNTALVSDVVVNKHPAPKGVHARPSSYPQPRLIRGVF